MRERDRAKLRLLLEAENDMGEDTFAEKLRAIYVSSSGRGGFQSGNTIGLAIDMFDSLAKNFITRCVDQAATIARDTEAFALVSETVDKFLSFLEDRVTEVAILASAGSKEASKGNSAVKSAEQRFAKKKIRLKRQLEIHRFDFTRPALDPAPAPKLIPEKSKNAGGKPLAEHWDKMWAAIAVQLYKGDLKPKTQADIERAMLDWLSTKDIDAGERTVRNRARALWQELIEAD